MKNGSASTLLFFYTKILMTKGEMNFMKVNELITMVKNDTNGIMNLSKVLETKRYIPVMRKYEIAQLIFAASSKVNNGLIEVDSLKKYLNFTALMLSEYTNLEFSSKEDGGFIADYDALCEAGLIDAIIGTFEEDYNRSLSVLNNLFADEIANHNTIESVLAELSQNIADSIDSVAESMKEKIESFEDGNIDMSGIENIMKVLGK